MKYFRLVANDIAIDLGTANTLVYKANKGIVLNEPSLVAIDITTGQVIGFGEEAYDMLGKTPENIVVIKPLENGAISDFDITKILIDHCLNAAQPGVSLFPPRAIITAQSGITDVEIRAIEDACIQSGVREVYIVESTLAAAIGAGMNVYKPNGHIVLNLGAGSTEMSIVSLNGIVSSKTLKYGGDFFNKKIMDHIYEKYSLIIGEKTAEEIKLVIGNVGRIDQNDCMEISGRDVMSAMPVNIDIFASDVEEAIGEYVFEIIDNLRFILEKNPPDLARDIMRNGIYITGGGSLLRGLPQLIEQEIGIRVEVSARPFEDTVKGAGKMIENLYKYKIIGKMR